MHSSMKTKRLDNFLYFFKLETGGLFFGWFGIVASLLMILFSILMIIGLFENVITDESLQQMGYVDPNEANQDAMDMARAFLFGICIVVTLFSVIYIVFCVLLIRGTKTANPRLLKPVVVFFGIYVFCAIIGLINFNSSSVFNLIYNAYAFAISYSLWRKFCSESVETVEGHLPPPATIEQDVTLSV